MSIHGFMDQNGQIQKYDYNDLENKPTIPAEVLIDDTLAEEGQAADAKAVGDAIANISIPVDDALSGNSMNPVQNRVIYDALQNSGLSQAAKNALLAIFQQVAYVDEHGQEYYDDLEEALNGGQSYTITYNLTGCVSSNTSTSINEGRTYFATITADSRYTLDGATATATMGGQTVTGFYNNGTISIPNVTGDLVITVTATFSVASISAVFTQGSATIYDTDSLDDLMQYLVVTATYADSSTAVVNDYTLTGTLVEGTSTITVSYGGMTDTFTVTVTHNDDADWDYVWRYTDGEPDPGEWSWSKTGGTSGAYHTIEDDGMWMRSKSGYTSAYSLIDAPSEIAAANGCTYEISLYIPNYTEGKYTDVQYLRVSAGNGSNGIAFSFTHPNYNTFIATQLNINLADNSDVYRGTKIGSFNYLTRYTIRMEMDFLTNKGRVYINDALAYSTDDITTITATTVSLYTNGGTGTVDGTSYGAGAVIQSIRLKYEQPVLS